METIYPQDLAEMPHDKKILVASSIKELASLVLAHSGHDYEPFPYTSKPWGISPQANRTNGGLILSFLHAWPMDILTPWGSVCLGYQDGVYDVEDLCSRGRLKLEPYAGLDHWGTPAHKRVRFDWMSVKSIGERVLQLPEVHPMEPEARDWSPVLNEFAHCMGLDPTSVRML